MRQRGFTLIEMLVAVTVMASILMMAMPSVAAWLGNTRVRNVADSLQNGLQIARAEAVRRNQSVSFWLVAGSDPTALANDCILSGGSGSWVVSVSSPVGHCADEPSIISSPMLVTGRPVGDTGGSISVTAVQRADAALVGNAVTFDGFGRVTNTDAIGQINVVGPGSSINLRVAVSSAGLVRMCDPRVSNGNDPRKC